MVVPAVSPRNWERTRGVCHFVMGVPIEVVDDLAFRDQLEVVIDHSGEFLEQASENREENNGSSTTYSVHASFDATKDDPYRFVAVPDQQEDHRPEVPKHIVTGLEDAVKSERPAVPASKFDFDRNLGILLDAAEEYYETLQCEIV